MKDSSHVSSMFGFGTIAALLIFLLFMSTALSGNQTVRAASTGEKLFGANCAACHQGGKNIVAPNKPIIGSSKLSNKDAFKSYLLKPTGTMPPSPAIANNGADLAALYDYCKTLK
jgi:mono/diheme cytochrome c family protein